MQQKAPTEQAFYRPADACRYLGVGRTKLHDLAETDPNFPRKIRISPRCVGWTRQQLDSWLESKVREVSA
ncbi:helix-turn-helix transcriptional regulator [Marinobacter changyiensis]|uniref:helix-turn-helix transcriptional regulator n=1 Tax=Marinobacter changyiensis TaxID=2604091 RepID=UPI001264EA72|nr:AlpA family phage regulatory protein [Marinobacter changyiensis]